MEDDQVSNLKGTVTAIEHKLNQILDTISRLPTVTVTPQSVVPDTLSNPEPADPETQTGDPQCLTETVRRG